MPDEQNPLDIGEGGSGTGVTTPMPAPVANPAAGPQSGQGASPQVAAPTPPGGGLAAAEQQVRSAMAQPMPEQPPAVNYPEVPQGPPITPQEFEKLSFGLIAMSLISGAASKGNWLGASAALNGAMEGFIAGRHDLVEHQFKEYQKQFEQAHAKETQDNKTFEGILKSRDKSINEMLHLYNIESVRANRQDQIAAAREGRIDHLAAQHDARVEQQAKMKDTHDLTMARIRELEARTEGSQARTALQKSGALPPESVDLLAQAYLGGDKSVLREAGTGAVGASNKAAILSRALELDPSLTGGERNARRAELSALNGVVTNNAKRAAASNRLLETFDAAYDIAQDTIKKASASGFGSLINKPINIIRSKLAGSPELGRLETLIAELPRVYSESITGAGLTSAQLSVYAQRHADALLNGNMSVQELLERSKAMREVLVRNKESIDSSVAKAENDIAKIGSKTGKPAAPKGAPPPPPGFSYFTPGSE